MLATFQPLIKDDGTRVGEYKTLCEHLLSFPNLLDSSDAAAREAAATAAPYLIIELLLQGIAALPPAPHMAAYLHRVVLELCKFSPKVSHSLKLYHTSVTALHTHRQLSPTSLPEEVSIQNVMLHCLLHGTVYLCVFVALCLILMSHVFR